MAPAESEESSSFLSRLKFRVVQPVDIPRCHQLESSAYPAEAAASKSTLQHMQHHAAPFFRCVLLKKSKQKGKSEMHALELLEENESEACHHVHHSPQNELIGYVCGTRYRGVSNEEATEGEPSKSYEKSHSYLYPTKHEPSGRFLAIHSIVVQKEYQRLGVARALLDYYLKSIEIYNAELDEAGINRRRNKLKAKKSDAKIEKIILLTKSSMSNLFLQVGFRWRATIEVGEDPLYEMEREVPSDHSSLPLSTLKQPYPLMEQDCFLVDAFANPNEWGSGNPAAVVVLPSCPTKLIADFCNTSAELFNSMNGSEIQEEKELAQMRAETWMQSVAKEFNQPATAFVWPIIIDKRQETVRQNSICSAMSDDELNISYHEEYSNGSETQETHHFIRFYTWAGVEVDMCSHATLAAASVLFSRCDIGLAGEERSILSFHSRKDIILRASLIPTTLTEESNSSPQLPSPQQNSSLDKPPKLALQEPLHNIEHNSIRVAMDYPWRSVEPVPPGPEGQGAILAMLRRAFFRAWSAVAPDQNDDDTETDEMAFSLSLHHVIFMGVTDDGEDILVELSTEGFDMLSGRSADYDALKQGWSGYKRGLIICCDSPEDTPSDASAGSEVQLNVHAENGHDKQNLSEKVSIDFRSRYFQTKHGSEDPVSGWPHCALGPYFGGRQGKRRVFGMQSSGRGGLVECILQEGEQKVCIVGAASTTLAGKILMRA